MGSSRDRTFFAAAAAFLLVSLVAGLVLLGGGEGGSDTGELETADGVIVEVTNERLRMRLARPLDGEDVIELEVRDADRRTLDLPHLRDHSSFGLPTRVYFQRSGDSYLARRAIDLPALP